MKKKSGAYLGTEIGERWWKRYCKDGFFAGGDGEYWHENGGLYFRRCLTKKPLIVAYHNVQAIKYFHSSPSMLTCTICKKKPIGGRESKNFLLNFSLSP